MAKRPEDRFDSAEELLRVIDGIPYGDIGAQSAPHADDTVVLSRVPESTPHRRSVPGAPQASPAPTLKRRLGLAIASIGIAGLAVVAASIYYSGLLTPEAGKSAASPPVLPTKPRVPEPGALPGAPDQSGARAVQTPPPPVPEAPTARPGPGVGTEPTPNAKPTLPRALTGPQVQGQPPIEALLRQAERQLKAGRLTEPPGDNAFESYNRILDLDPENPEAEEALVKIGRINAANRVFSSADALLRQGAINEARRMIDTGLKMNPDDERLLGLRRALD